MTLMRHACWRDMGGGGSKATVVLVSTGVIASWRGISSHVALWSGLVVCRSI